MRDIELSTEQVAALRARNPIYNGQCLGAAGRVALVRTTLRASDDRIRLTCYLYADHVSKQAEVEDFWLEVTQLGRSNMCRSIVNNYSRRSKRKRQRMLPYGTVKVAVHETRLIQMVVVLGGIQEIGGFTRESWLE